MGARWEPAFDAHVGKHNNENTCNMDTGMYSLYLYFAHHVAQVYSIYFFTFPCTCYVALFYYPTN